MADLFETVKGIAKEYDTRIIDLSNIQPEKLNEALLGAVKTIVKRGGWTQEVSNDNDEPDAYELRCEAEEALSDWRDER